MGLISNTVERWELKEGDHIYVWRKLGLCAYHGIYIGNDMVIHYGADLKPNIKSNCKKCCDYAERLIGKSGKRGHGVRVSCLDCFVKGHTLKRFDYSVSEIRYLVHRDMTCATVPCFEPEKVKALAIEYLQQGFGPSDFVADTSQDFAYFCKTGRSPKRSNLIQQTALMCAAGAVGMTAAAAATAGAAFAYDKYRDNVKSGLKSNNDPATN